MGNSYCRVEQKNARRCCPHETREWRTDRGWRLFLQWAGASSSSVSPPTSPRAGSRRVIFPPPDLNLPDLSHTSSAFLRFPSRWFPTASIHKLTQPSPPVTLGTHSWVQHRLHPYSGSVSVQTSTRELKPVCVPVCATKQKLRAGSGRPTPPALFQDGRTATSRCSRSSLPIGCPELVLQ